jgi:hypothetical protein
MNTTDNKFNITADQIIDHLKSLKFTAKEQAEANHMINVIELAKLFIETLPKLNPNEK